MDLDGVFREYEKQYRGEHDDSPYNVHASHIVSVEEQRRLATNGDHPDNYRWVTLCSCASR
jgi:hypothetical protein